MTIAERVKAVRARALIRRWEYRQRNIGRARGLSATLDVPGPHDRRGRARSSRRGGFEDYEGPVSDEVVNVFTR